MERPIEGEFRHLEYWVDFDRVIINATNVRATGQGNINVRPGRHDAVLTFVLKKPQAFSLEVSVQVEESLDE